AHRPATRAGRRATYGAFVPAIVMPDKSTEAQLVRKKQHAARADQKARDRVLSRRIRQRTKERSAAPFRVGEHLVENLPGREAVVELVQGCGQPLARAAGFALVVARGKLDLGYHFSVSFAI